MQEPNQQQEEDIKVLDQEEKGQLFVTTCFANSEESEN